VQDVKKGTAYHIYLILTLSLSLLQPDTLPGYSSNTILLLRAGFFFREGLYQEARRELLAGIAADPNEPTLHLLLGHVFDRMGLKSAAAAFEEARLLSTLCS
jgi:Tfp pilus assembly protein PilF